MKGPSNASTLGAVVLTLASFSAGCRPTPIDVEESIKTTPVYTPPAAELSDRITAARPQHQDLLDQVLRAEKLLGVYDEHWFSPKFGTPTIGSSQIAPELRVIISKIDSALTREDAAFTERQSIALEQSSKALRTVERLMARAELKGGQYIGDSTWSSNLDSLYRAQAELTYARLHLSGAIKPVK